MIQEYKIQLAQQGYEYSASAPFSDQDVVNVVDSDKDKDYVDLETVGVWSFIKKMISAYNLFYLKHLK